MTWMRSPKKRMYTLPLAAVVGLVVAGMLFLNGSPLVARPIAGNIPRAIDLDPHPDVFETALVAMEARVDLGNGVLATAQTLNGTVPGPEIRLKVGDKVILDFNSQKADALRAAPANP